MGCCPFHDDSTVLMSVGGVPDRFRCFGRSASSDVIDVRQTAGQPPVHRLHRGPAERLEWKRRRVPLASPHTPSGQDPANLDLPRRRDQPDGVGTLRNTCGSRVCPELPGAPARHRLVALRAFAGGAAVVGYAGTGWTTLVSCLHNKGVSVGELLLLVTDLARFTRSGCLVDTYRG